MKFSRRSVLAGAFAVGLITLGTTAAVQAAPSLPSPNGSAALQAQAAQSADAFVAGHPAVVHPSADVPYGDRRERAGPVHVGRAAASGWHARRHAEARL